MKFYRRVKMVCMPEIEAGKVQSRLIGDQGDVIHKGGVMNKNLLLIVCLFGLSQGWIACAGGSEPIAIMLDPGGTARENRQMGERMERDLKNILEKRGGYHARILRSRTEYRQMAGEYLLDVRITRYNAGSKAARIVVGFGAGSASLNIHYELIGPGGNVLLSQDDGCGTSLDWQRLARKLNENILAAIQARFRAGNLEAAVSAPASAPQRAEPAAPPTIVATPVPVPVTSTPQPTPAPVPIQVAPGDPVEQLRQLDAMRKQRLISENEYKHKRKEILGRL